MGYWVIFCMSLYCFGCRIKQPFCAHLSWVKEKNTKQEKRNRVNEWKITLRVLDRCPLWRQRAALPTTSPHGLVRIILYKHVLLATNSDFSILYFRRQWPLNINFTLFSSFRPYFQPFSFPLEHISSLDIGLSYRYSGKSNIHFIIHMEVSLHVTINITELFNYTNDLLNGRKFDLRLG